MPKKEPPVWKELSDVGALGIEMVVSVVIAGGFGWWLDERLGTSPWFTVIGTAIGAAAGLRSAYRVITKDEHWDNSDKK